MINSKSNVYTFDEWYYISEDDLFSDQVEAYNDWVSNGESVSEAIYASHITIPGMPESSGTTEQEITEDESGTQNATQDIPVPNYTPTGNF